jgi:hypothetical protein
MRAAATVVILLAGLLLERTTDQISYALQNLAVTQRWPTFIRAAASALILMAGLLLEHTADLLSHALQNRPVTYRWPTFVLAALFFRFLQSRSRSLLHPTRRHHTLFGGHSAICEVGNGTPTIAPDAHGR